MSLYFIQRQVCHQRRFFRVYVNLLWTMNFIIFVLDSPYNYCNNTYTNCSHYRRPVADLILNVVIYHKLPFVCLFLYY